MKLRCDTGKLFAALANADDRQKFSEYFSGRRTFESMPLVEVSLPNKKTITQNNALWRDFEIAGKLLHCDSTFVYYQCLKAEQLQDVWLKETDDGWKFCSLSQLTKDNMTTATPQIHDYLQGLINDEYGEWVVINWSCKENVDKPDFELSKKN